MARGPGKAADDVPKGQEQQIRQVSQQFRQASSDSRLIASRLWEDLGNLANEWEGSTQERFWDDLRQWHGSMSQFAELLNSISQQLDSVAARFESANRGR